MPTFSPTFANPELEAQALVMCEGDSFCLFDVAATGSTEIGLSTLQGDIEFEMIVSISTPGEEEMYGTIIQVPMVPFGPGQVLPRLNVNLAMSRSVICAIEVIDSCTWLPP